MDLHAKIMNLPTDAQAEHAEYSNRREAYMYGHRDARHAAAALALEQQAELEALRKDAERWRTARKLARYSPSTDGGDYLAFDSLPWPRTCHATTPEYADAAIDAAMKG